MFASFGTTDFLMKQSIVPVLAWKNGDDSVKCIGTASVISCSGYLLTAAHVIMDPFERGYGGVRQGTQLSPDPALNFGVFIPLNPAYGSRRFRFFPFEEYWIWGGWKESPLFNQRDEFEYLTDIAICKIGEMPFGAAHQHLGLSLNPFVSEEAAYSMGYAEMADIGLNYSDEDSVAFCEFSMELYIRRQNYGFIEKIILRRRCLRQGRASTSTLNIPGKMSGAPVFGAQGAVIRGVVN